MRNIPIKHHYTPRFYLNGFLASNKNMLSVLNIKTGNLFYSKPENVGFQNNLYSIEKTDKINIETDTLEKTFAEIERRAAKVIRNIEKEKVLPNTADFNVLINFIALLKCRVPKRIKQSAEPLINLSKMILNMKYASKESYYEMINQMKSEGLYNGNVPEYEQMLNFINSDRYEIDMDQNSKLKTILDQIDNLIPYLGSRKWSLIFTNEHNGGFVCSDNPVSLVWIDQQMRLSPGFGMIDTEVTVPLTKEIALLGKFDGDEKIVSADIKDLAEINSRTIMYADKFIFSSNDDFMCIRKDGTISKRNEFVKDINEKLNRSKK